MKFEKDIKYAVLSLLVFIIEVSFGKYIAISGAVPMLTFSFLIVTAMLESDISYVIMLSVLLGAISDILYGHGFGTYTAAFFLSCYCTFKLKNAIFYSKWLFLTIDSFLLTIIVQVFYMIIHIQDIGASNFFRCIWSLILPTAIYNMLICWLFYFLGSRILAKRR